MGHIHVCRCGFGHGLLWVGGVYLVSVPESGL